PERQLDEPEQSATAERDGGQAFRLRRQRLFCSRERFVRASGIRVDQRKGVLVRALEVEHLRLRGVGRSLLRTGVGELEIARETFGHAVRDAENRESALISLLERKRADLVEVRARRIEVVTEALVCQRTMHPRQRLERQLMFDFELRRDAPLDEFRPLGAATLKGNGCRL